MQRRDEAREELKTFDTDIVMDQKTYPVYLSKNLSDLLKNLYQEVKKD